MASGNPYAAELAAAKKAVTLAARLCQVPLPVLRAPPFSSQPSCGRIKSVAAS